jgi:hypothetical protein
MEGRDQCDQMRLDDGRQFAGCFGNTDAGRELGLYRMPRQARLDAPGTLPQKEELTL